MSRDYVLLLNVSEVVMDSFEASPRVGVRSLPWRGDICWSSTLAAIAEAWAAWAMQGAYFSNPDTEPIRLVLMLTFGDGFTQQQYTTLRMLRAAGYTVIEALEDKLDGDDGSLFAGLWQAMRLGEWDGWQDIAQHVRLKYHATGGPKK